MAIFAFFVTIFVGFFASGIFGSWLNWPDAGAVFAVATMGAFILHEVRKLTRETPEWPEEPWKQREREAKEKAESEQEGGQP